MEMLSDVSSTLTAFTNKKGCSHCGQLFCVAEIQEKRTHMRGKACGIMVKTGGALW